jgi:hypothetical protein
MPELRSNTTTRYAIAASFPGVAVRGVAEIHAFRGHRMAAGLARLRDARQAVQRIVGVLVIVVARPTAS